MDRKSPEASTLLGNFDDVVFAAMRLLVLTTSIYQRSSREGGFRTRLTISKSDLLDSNQKCSRPLDCQLDCEIYETWNISMNTNHSTFQGNKSCSVEFSSTDAVNGGSQPKS